ncbi:MAG TPA: ABC transporter ATP-binding protein [Chitinophagaceae bacterium]|nr:ABC transporter ATP-binding protein [Chitinophagaceae bacterium]
MSTSKKPGAELKNSAGKSNRRSQNLTHLVMGLISPYRKWLMVILIAMLLETVISLAAPWPLKIIIDNVISQNPLPPGLSWLNTLFPGEHLMGLAASCGILLVLLTAIGGLAGYIDNYYTESVAQYIAHDLRKRTYHHLQHLSLAYYDSHQVGKLLSTITTDINTIQDFVSSTILSILVDSVTILGMFALMLYLRWDFALISVGMAPFLLLFIVRFKKAVKKATHEVRIDQAEMITVIQNGLESIRTVNVFGRHDLEEDRMQKVSMDTVHAALRARKIKSVISPVFALGVSMCIGFVLWRGSILIRADLMTLGALTVFLSYMNKFFNPVKDLAKMTVGIAQATVALERIQQILAADIIIPQKPGAKDPGKLRGDIEFEHVFFSYTAGIPVLQDINISIRPGQRIGICGPTGSGKSTLAGLIPRLYDISSGRLLIDGRDITDYTLEGLRRNIGFVLQDTMLFFGTIRDNIAYGKPDANDIEIIEAARLANADEFIMKLPKGYKSIVGERGITLSGGERQRIGIARAVLRNAPILILDEPTTSLDLESEKTVLEALERLMKGRTVITISHKLNTIIQSDKIIVIKDGTVAEQGNHQSLFTKKAVYSELYGIYNAARKDDASNKKY